MGQNNFAGNVLQLLLSWLQSLMSGVWSLFSGAGGGSVLRWFSENWLSLLIVFMVIGIALDVLVYLFRWRPFWWWFRKKRLVVDDMILEDEPFAEAPRRAHAPPRPAQPSTYVPRRQTAARSDDDLFMDAPLFDVKTSERDSLYAPGAKARTKRPASTKTRSTRR